MVQIIGYQCNVLLAKRVYCKSNQLKSGRRFCLLILNSYSPKYLSTLSKAVLLQNFLLS